MFRVSRRHFVTTTAGAVLATTLGLKPPTVHAATAASDNYFDYSREDWGANPAWDCRKDTFFPSNNRPTTVTSPDLDTGIYYYPTIQPGQRIAVASAIQTPTGLGIHYTATPGTWTFADTAAQLRGMQEYHAIEDWGHLIYGPNNPDPKKESTNDGLLDSTFGDLGYHLLIDCAGKVYEGRAGGIFRQGVHIHRHNHGLVGIAMIGNYPNSQPPPAQYAALVKLCARLCHDLHINPMALRQQALLDNTTEYLTKNGRAVFAVDGHISYPDNNHTDPGAVDLNKLRTDIKALIPVESSITFPQTGQTLAEPFLSYWEANGALAIFGYPISPVHQEVNRDDGKTYAVQYFERNRFELHPEHIGTAAYVLLGRLGVLAAAKSKLANPGPFAPIDPLTSGEDGLYFLATGHYLRYGFRTYWEAHGGLALFGYPLSEEFREVGEGGVTYIVQYFERARFEYHPEAPPQYQVLLGRLGAQFYQPTA